MGAGLVAMSIGIVKTILYGEIISDIDYFFKLSDLAIWIHVELFIGIIATCVPCLKSFFERGIKKIGVHLSSQATTNNDSSRDYAAKDRNAPYVSHSSTLRSPQFEYSGAWSGPSGEVSAAVNSQDGSMDVDQKDRIVADISITQESIYDNKAE